eukprot:PhF_6_TR2254/c0_g1_i2/m.3862
MLSSIAVASPTSQRSRQHNAYIQVIKLRQHDEFVNEHSTLHQQLQSATDFCLLSEDQINNLCVLRREYAPLDVITQMGTTALHCWVVLKGTVDVFRPDTNGAFRRCGRIVAPNSFGGDDVLLRQPHSFLYKAGTTRTVLALIPGHEYVALIRGFRPFAQSIGRRIVERFDIFSRFRAFCKEVFAKQEMVDVSGLVQKYYELDSVIHTKINDPVIDTSAWSYSINRLPTNITSTFVFDLVRVLPPFLSGRMKKAVEGGSQKGVVYVPTKERRRYAWQVGSQGKTVVLLRDSFTDLLDFLTCFCIHVVEARKLRVRITALPLAVDQLEEAALREQDDEQVDESLVLENLPFTPDELAGLKALWPEGRRLKSMYDVIMHKEMYMIRVAETSNTYEIDPFHAWMLNIRGTLLGALGLSADEEIPENLVVDVISSNNHSVKNLLSPFVRQNRESILEWAATNAAPFVPPAMVWNNEEDMLYFILYKYLSANPEKSQAFRTELEHYGILLIEDTSLT